MPNLDENGHVFTGVTDLAMRRTLLAVLRERFTRRHGRDLPATVTVCQRPTPCVSCYDNTRAVAEVPTRVIDYPNALCTQHIETLYTAALPFTCADCGHRWQGRMAQFTTWMRGGRVSGQAVVTDGSCLLCERCSEVYTPCTECARFYRTDRDAQCCTPTPRCVFCNGRGSDERPHATNVEVMSRYSFNDVETLAHVCVDCLQTNITTCVDCTRQVRTVDTYVTGTGVHACSGCVRGYVTTEHAWNVCSRHGIAYRPAIEELDCCDPNAQLRSYSYKPTPIMRGQGPIHFGVEIEICTNDSDASLRVAGKGFRDLFYYKEDGSIRRGFEMVSHPATWGYWLDSVRWDTFGELANSGAYEHESCGIHVHASRSGFSGAAHEHRWLAFFDRNQQNIEKVARRKGSSYARFGRLTAADKKRIATHQQGRPGYFERYCAVNVNNAGTYEVRIFATSLNPVVIQGSIGFVAASIEYTRQLTARDTMKSGGMTWEGFRNWCESRPEYAVLINEMNRVGA